MTNRLLIKGSFCGEIQQPKLGLLLFSLMFLTTAPAARASTGWICNESYVETNDPKQMETISNFLQKYEVAGSELLTPEEPGYTAPGALLPSRFGELPDSWRILVNNSTGLIADQTESDVVSSKAVVFGDIILINKLSLTIKEFYSAADGSPLTVISGTCEGF